MLTARHLFMQSITQTVVYSNKSTQTLSSMRVLATERYLVAQRATFAHQNSLDWIALVAEVLTGKQQA